MILELNGKKYEIDNNELEGLLTEHLVLKVDELLNEQGAAAPMIRSMLNSTLSMRGFKKVEGLSLLESSLVEMISVVLEENKDKEFKLQLKEVVEDDQRKN